MIAIYSNSQIFGGVEVIVYRFAKYLHKHNIPFCVIERKGTRIYNDLEGANVIETSRISEIAGRIDHVFLPSVAKLADPHMSDIAHIDANIFSWVVNPNDPFAFFFPFAARLMNWTGYRGVKWIKELMSGHGKNVERVFQTMIDGDGLAVMDGATSRALRYFYPSLTGNPKLFPIPTIPDTTTTCNRIKERSNGISIGYLGRLDEFKLSALEPFISVSLRPVMAGQSIKIHTVAEGVMSNRLRSICKRLDIDLFEYGFLPNKLARQIIKSKTDFAVAMGTSALDIASSAHPCIIIDPALRASAPAQTSFRFVHEICDYTIGEYRDFPGYVQGIHDIHGVLDKIENYDVNLIDRNYVLRSHDSEHIFSRIVKGIINSKSNMSNIGPLIQEMNDSFQYIRNLVPGPSLGSVLPK